MKCTFNESVICDSKTCKKDKTLPNLIWRLQINILEKASGITVIAQFICLGYDPVPCVVQFRVLSDQSACIGQPQQFWTTDFNFSRLSIPFKLIEAIQEGLTKALRALGVVYHQSFSHMV